jgi:hypothetical protein
VRPGAATRKERRRARLYNWEKRVNKLSNDSRTLFFKYLFFLISKGDERPVWKSMPLEAQYLAY